MIETKYATIDRDELKRLQADSAELARLRESVGQAYQLAALAEHSNWIRNRPTDQAVEYLWKKGWRIAPEPIPEGFVLVPVDPTREMWAASGDAIVALQGSGHCHHDIITGAVYRAMLAAAPKGDSHE